MKKFLSNFIAGRWFGFITAMIITILLMTQELMLGDMSNSWALGLLTSLFLGFIVEASRLIITGQAIWKYIIMYLLGSIVAIIIMYLVA